MCRNEPSETINAARHLNLGLGGRFGILRKDSRMGRWYPVTLFVALAGGVGCQHMKRSETFAHYGFARVIFQVHGMMKAKSGAT